MDERNEEIMGFTRKMVFYRGKAPDGVKTNWKLREYRLNPGWSRLKNPHDSKMDSCVACKVETVKAEEF